MDQAFPLIKASAMRANIAAAGTAISGAGGGLALYAELVPAWLAVTLITISILTAIGLAVAHAVVTEYIRVRSSKTNPVRAHRIDARRRRGTPDRRS